VKAENTSDFNRLANIFNAWLKPQVSGSAGGLAEISSYTLQLPGKRLRPVLCLAVAEMLDVKLDSLRTPCLSLEYIHVYSLIHDDLPALDDDSLRRGQATAHIKFGEAAALLAADHLQAQAYKVLTSDRSIPAETRLAVLDTIAKASMDLCEGQLLDVSAPKKGTFEQQLAELEKRHSLKTGALIRAALSIPSHFLPELERAAMQSRLEEFGHHFGLLFQITDDILDVTSSEEAMGKDLSSDEERGTPTYVSVCGLERAQELAAESANLAKKSLSEFGEKAGFLQSLCDVIRLRDR